jgi:5-hydroxyisourate hydrolase
MRNSWRLVVLAALALPVGVPTAAQKDTKLAPRRPLSVHVLDTMRGKPAPGLQVVLEQQTDKGWQELARARTDKDGRVNDLWPPARAVQPGTYRITFITGPYFSATRTKTFYPRIPVVFALDDPAERYHVPLLLSPFGYSTYRGS